MSPRFVLGRENVPCVAEVVNRSLKADCTDFTCLTNKSCVKSTCWDRRATDSIIESVQKDTEAGIIGLIFHLCR